MVGRPESTLDPDAGPLAAFAMDLRVLRQTAGQPSYRQLAKIAHYSSATLAQATSGRRLPSLEVTLALVRACGGDSASWATRWHTLAAAASSSANLTPPTPAPAHPALTRWRQTTGAPLRTIGPAIALTAVLAGCLGAWAGHTSTAGHANTQIGDGRQAAAAAAPGDAQRAVSDGADPIQANCDQDGITLASQVLRDKTGGPLADVELRYSPRCNAGWARFHTGTISSTTGSVDPRGAPLITVTIERPSDTTMSQFRYRFDGRNVYSDLLLTNRSCLRATAIAQINNVTTTKATTECRAGI